MKEPKGSFYYLYMKSFSELSHNIYSLTESLFDYDNEKGVEQAIEKDSIEAFLASCSGRCAVQHMKDGSVKVSGKLVVKDIKEKRLIFNCKEFKGQLIIENCPNLETLEGSFLEKITIFDGSITLNQCPSLVSIKGIPALVKGDVSITNCKKLKDFGTLDSVFGNLYWEHNGKKYTEEQISKLVHVLKKVFCSVEDQEANLIEGEVNEAFNNPWLQRLAKQLKRYPYKDWSWQEDSEKKYNDVDTIFKQYGRSYSNYHGRFLDKISNSDIDVYDMGNKKDHDAVGKAFYDAYSQKNQKGSDIMFVFDENLGEFIGGFGHAVKPRGYDSEVIEFFYIPNKGNNSGAKISGRYFGKSIAREKLLSYGEGYTIVVINTGVDTGTGGDERYDLQQKRTESREGMINPGDVDQYKTIAAQNIKRYKEIIAQNKANAKKNDASYDKMIDKFESIMMRVLKLTRLITKDPKSYNRWDVNNFITWVRDEQRRNPTYRYGSHRGGPEYYGEYGLMYRFKQYVDAYMGCFGNSYKLQPDKSDYDQLEQYSNLLQNNIELADKKLKSFGV